MGMAIQSEYLDRPLVAGRAWDLVLPEGEAGPVAVFFVHGGGWRMGSRDRFHTIMELLSGRGFACGSTDYRLEGVTVTDQLADVRHAYARFVQCLAAAGGPERVVGFGSSAGAHLGLLLALAEPGACGEALPDDPDLAEAARRRPAGVAVQSAIVTLEPWTDIFPGMWRPIQNAVGTPYDQRPDLYTRASPIHYIDERSPPVFLMEAQYEHMVPPHVVRQFHDRMQDAGRRVELKTYPATEHGFLYDTTRWQQAEAIEDLITFARSLA